MQKGSNERVLNSGIKMVFGKGIDKFLALS